MDSLDSGDAGAKTLGEAAARLKVSEDALLTDVLAGPRGPFDEIHREHLGGPELKRR